MTPPYNPSGSSVPGVADIWPFQGYDQASQSDYPTASRANASGYFERPDGQQLHVWISDITADFAISGVTGQSRMRREFFSHSFNDITLTIIGNVASTQEYNRLALFVREHHWQALSAINGGVATDVEQTLTFVLGDTYEGGRWPAKGLRRATASIPDNGDVRSQASNVKGPHKPWRVAGYIRSVAAGATANEVGPQFQIAFTVSASTKTPGTGIWSDYQVSEDSQKLLSFRDLLKIANGNDRVQAAGFVPNPSPQPLSPQATAELRAGAHAVTTWTEAVAQNLLGGVEDLLGLSSVNRIGGAQP